MDVGFAYHAVIARTVGAPQVAVFCAGPSFPTVMQPTGEVSRRNVEIQLNPELNEIDFLDHLITEMDFVHHTATPKQKRKRKSRDTSARSFEGSGILPPAGESEWDPSVLSYHTGKWPIEEERYANRLVLEFEAGVLDDCKDGVTLRSYLAKTLRCAPMRVSKKLAGKCIGSKVFCRQQGDRQQFLERIAAGELNIVSLQKRIKQKLSVTERKNNSNILRSRSSSDLTDDESSSVSSTFTDDKDDNDDDSFRNKKRAITKSGKDIEGHLWRRADEVVAAEDIFYCPLLAELQNSNEQGFDFYLAENVDAVLDKSSPHVIDVGYDEWKDALSYFKESECIYSPSEEEL